MANHLDLEEQEQLDQLKHFWAQYGNLITWVLIAVFGSFAAWNGWNYWQRTQATKAAALYDEIDRAATARDADKMARSLSEMQDRFGGSTFAAQGALLAGKTLFEAGKPDAARAALGWVSEKSSDEAYQAIARLRLAGLDVEAKAYDQALKTLEAPMPKAFEALAADRRGDVYLAQGKADEARQQYEAAWRSFGKRVEYRNLVEVKLASLGVDAATLTPPAEAAR
ncbi:tetratricopeptide repeat protein [Hydrogenophaga sp.]|uniref:YfgM family protein n=1 Tax=Hydrogenophaga sp. TaxID=1904254 RepID=UPI00286DA73F|nr:tetratricopeptide repeat protein [Hydrogenophaga sp.]